MNTYIYDEQYQMISKIERKPDGSFDPGTGGRATMSADFLPDGGVCYRSNLDHTMYLSITAAQGKSGGPGTDLGKLMTGTKGVLNFAYKRHDITCDSDGENIKFTVGGQAFEAGSALESLAAALESIESTA